MTDRTKANGIHYTPPKLAAFLAAAVGEHLPARGAPVRVLDPACGDGALLQAILETFPQQSRGALRLTGVESDARALEAARARLAPLGAGELNLLEADFLTLEDGSTNSALQGAERLPSAFDVVLANPPYVRTQVLGARQSQALARRFGLAGRVDLYHAFAVAMARRLGSQGVLGLLTSNRFLTTRSGQSLRRFLREGLDIRAVYDLGDTKLFSAAVLPVVVVATKRAGAGRAAAATFSRVYHSCGDAADAAATRFEHVLDAVNDGRVSGPVRTGCGAFHVERGVLAADRDPGAVWTLSTPRTARWLAQIRGAQRCAIEDVATVKVGIKTTADKVFVRDDWHTLPPRQRPEETLLRPLITHHEAARWSAGSRPARRVLYPYGERNGAKKMPVDLDDFPRARAYLESHADRLRARQYVTAAGRQWYEIWVPHAPGDWRREKLVFPDISVGPRFFYDPGGAIVQGDCYWLVTRADVEPDWLYVILAVCNSTLITRFYDAVFHNKLYSGRRRYMTQYVNKFPLPPLDSPATRTLVSETKNIVHDGESPIGETRLDSLVWQAFGLEDPPTGSR